LEELDQPEQLRVNTSSTLVKKVNKAMEFQRFEKSPPPQAAEVMFHPRE